MASESALTTTNPTRDPATELPPTEAATTPPGPPAILEPVRDPAGPVLVALLLLLAVTTALVPIRNSDFFQHLALGRWLAQGHLPVGSDPLTSPAEPVASAHQTWLFDLGLYLLFLGGGAILILIVKALATVLVVEQWRRGATLPNTRAAPTVLCLLLGLVVLSPYLIVQSRLASIVLLSTTLYLLGRYRSGRVPPVWALPVLCLVWANVDNWFFLGPLCIGLFLGGTYLDTYLESRDKETEPRPLSLSSPLVVSLFCSLLAMCLNPGLLALRFDLPPELGLNNCLVYVSELPGYTYLSATPVSSDYFQATTGWTVAGQGYFLLLLLALASFPLLGRRMAWSGFCVVAGLGLLSLYRVAAIPFFVVAATPWLARNIQELLALQAVAQPGKKTDATGGVLLAGLLLLLTGVATVPGWLNAWPWSNHRFGIGLEPEADLREMAEQTVALGEWYRTKSGEAMPAWLNTSPAAAHYIAWYAPDQRCYIDQRLILSTEAAKDYLGIVQTPYLTSADLVKLLEGGALKDLPDRYGILRKRGVRFLACHQADLVANGTQVRGAADIAPEDRVRTVPLVMMLFQMYAMHGDWPLLNLRGGTALFGFRDPADKARSRFFHDKTMRTFARAFAERPDYVPLEPPSQEAVPHSWITTLWDPEPPRPLDVQEAAQFALLYQASKNPMWFQTIRIWEVCQATAKAGYGLSAGTTAPWQSAAAALSLQRRFMYPGNPQTNTLPGPLARTFFDDRDIGTPAALYLMVRAARRAVAENPFDPKAHLALAEAYTQLSTETRERGRGQGFVHLLQLRRFQIIAAAQAAVRLDPDLEEGHRILASTYRDLRYIDLFVDQEREALRCNVAAGPYPGETAEAAHDRWNKQDADLQKMSKEVDRRVNSFKVQATRMKGAPVRQALEALRTEPGEGAGGFGLVKVASDILKGLKAEELGEAVNGQRPGPGLTVETFLLQGEIGDAKRFLGQDLETDAFGTHPSMGLPAFEWYRFCLGACSGDYDMADEAAVAMLAKAQANPEFAVARKQSVGLLVDLIAMLGTRFHVPPPPGTFALPPGPILPLPYGPNRLALCIQLANQARQGPGTVATLHTLRGWVALEEGDIGKVRTELEAALKVAHQADLAFPGQRIAELGLELLKRGEEAARAP